MGFASWELWNGNFGGRSHEKVPGHKRDIQTRPGSNLNLGETVFKNPGESPEGLLTGY